jgi:single-strand DNA-binding protein
MQKFIATGRLTKDSEVRYSQGGQAVAKFDIAIGKRFKREGEADADFFSCVAFGKTAETIDKCKIAKGTKLLIEGEVQNNNYTKDDGTKVYGTQILVNSFEFCESKASAQQEEPKPMPNSDGFMNIPDGIDEELPFN